MNNNLEEKSSLKPEEEKRYHQHELRDANKKVICFMREQDVVEEVPARGTFGAFE